MKSGNDEIFIYTSLKLFNEFLHNPMLATVQLTDLNGKLLTETLSINEGINCHSLSAAQFASGIYLVNIKGKEFGRSGEVVVNGK
jgi:hypothetical protein